MKTNLTKKKIITVASIFLALAILVGSCAIYLCSYYRADTSAIESFEPIKRISQRTLDDGTVIFEPEGEPVAGLIFYPGGKVEYTSYAPLMAACAEKGIFCVLLKMPFNLAVFRINAADGIQEQFPNIENWYISGHSLGGSMAATYLSKHQEAFRGIILLGSYSTADISSDNLTALSIYGSEDKIINQNKYQQNKNNLPSTLKEVILEGGNHAYFGMYGEQKGDGAARISNEEQIYITAATIFDFITQ